MPSFSDARALAERMLADHLPGRWERAQDLAREALRVAGLDGVDRDTLIQAAVLLEIGHSPVVARTGFAPLDGARFLAARGYDARVAGLVAHHGAADVEARLRDVGGLDAFRDDAGPTRDALRFCADAVGPRPDDDVVVTRALDLADPDLRAAVERTRARLAAQT